MTVTDVTVGVPITGAELLLLLELLDDPLLLLLLDPPPELLEGVEGLCEAQKAVTASHSDFLTFIDLPSGIAQLTILVDANIYGMYLKDLNPFFMTIFGVGFLKFLDDKVFLEGLTVFAEAEPKIAGIPTK